MVCILDSYFYKSLLALGGVSWHFIISLLRSLACILYRGSINGCQSPRKQDNIHFGPFFELWLGQFLVRIDLSKGMEDIVC